MGILALEPRTETGLTPDQKQLLETFANQIALALEHIQLTTQAEQARVLEASDHFRSALLSSISHDLRTPLAAYVDVLHNQQPDAFVSIVLPEFIPAHWWESFLHNRTAGSLRKEFERHPNVAVVQVPYVLAH